MQGHGGDCDGAAAASRYAGRATSAARPLRISRGATGDEVSLQLDAGLQLVGFAAAGQRHEGQNPVQRR